MDPVNALSFDVEDYFQVSAFEGVVDRRDWDTMPSRVVGNTRRLMDLLGGVRATFFVLGWVAERHPALVWEIAARGHEVACHGYSHRLVYRQTPEEFTSETVRAKAALEDVIGCPVEGYRAASYSIVERSLWALDILADLGFRYDSSIYPVHHDRYGIPDAPRFPHRRALAGGRRIVEFPIASVRRFGHNLPVGGGGYFRLLPYGLTRSALRRINEEGWPFVFYLHPWEIDPGQPRIRAGLLSRFRHYNSLRHCEERFRRLLDDFSFAPLGQVLAGLDLLEPGEPESNMDVMGGSVCVTRDGS